MKPTARYVPLHRKIGLVLLAAFLLLACVLWLFLVLLQRTHFENAVRQAEQYLEMLVAMESGPLANELFEKRLRALELRSREILSMEGILAVTLYGAGGDPLVYHDRGGHDATDVEKGRKAPSLKDSKRARGVWQGVPALVYEAPILAVGAPIGSIRVLYSLAEAERQRRLSYFVAGLLLTITFVLVLLSVNRALYVTVSRPIKALKDAIERIEIEGPGERIAETPKDEIGDLIGSFNRMSGQLQGMLSRLQGEIAERKRTEEELRRRTHQLEAIRGVAEEITRELNPDRLLKLILRRAMELTGAEGGAVGLVDETREMLVPRVSFGEVFAPAVTAPFPIGEGVSGRVAESRTGMIVNDYKSWPGARPAVIQTTAVQAVLAEPMFCHDKLLGVITLANTDRKGSFEEHHLSTLRLFAGQAAIAIENARLYEEAQSDAIELQTRLQQIAAAQREKEDLTRQLYQAQKLEAIGTLAGGIAHDFNNILVPIIMGAELALMTVPVENQAYPMVQKILTAAMRAKDLVQQILAFSRQSDLERAPLHLGPLIKETLKLARASLPSTIEIRHDIAAQKDMVLANPTQVHQVLMNLFTNAGHAMRVNGGVLEVRLEEEIVEDGRALGVPELGKGHFAKILVTDTGHGMDASTLAQIFNPFFTTKERSEGTGLGLSIVHGIIKSYGGAITVESRPGQGTRFTIWIPLVEAEPKDRPAGAAPLPIGTERILFVDDEPSITEVGRKILETLGYRVETSQDPLEALEEFKRHRGRYDLLITDMTMPKMTGDKLAAECLKIRPDLPILLCTGFSESMTEAAAVEMGIRGFILKPIAVAEIAREIRKALSRQKALTS